MSPIAGQQSYEAQQIMARDFPELNEMDNIVAYFHNYNRDNITSFPCIENVSLGIKNDILDAEQKQHRKISTDILGYYLVNNSMEREQFLSHNKNATLVLTSLNTSGVYYLFDFK
jgi:hypothetical protein